MPTLPPLPPIYRVPGAANRDLTIAADATSLDVVVDLCEGNLSTFLISACEGTYGAGDYYLIVEPSSTSKFSRLLYSIPERLVATATRDTLAISASIPRSSFVGVGFPSEWTYLLCGIAMPIDAEGVFTPGVPQVDGVLWTFLSGKVTVADQTVTPGLVCSVNGA